MNIILPVGSPGASDVHTGDHLVPDTSMLPEQDSVTRERRRPTGAWVDRVRHTVSSRPLAAVAAAFALGSLVTRLRR